MSELVDNKQWPLNSLLVSQPHRVIYTPIAKNANTTLKALFVRLSGHPDTAEILGDDVHISLNSRRTGLGLCDYDPAEATRILADPSYFSFTVLRNPLARAVSAYIDKFIVSPPPAGPDGEPPIVIADAIDWVYGQRGEAPDYEWSITFNEFVDYVTSHEDHQLDTHFKSQHSYRAGQRFDHVGTLENLQALMQVLEERFGQRPTLEWENRTAKERPPHPRKGLASLVPFQLRLEKAPPHASELLTPRVTRLLEERYARDLEMWREAQES